MRKTKRAAWRVVLALALVAGAASAQDVAVKKPRPPQPPAATAPADASNATSSSTLRGPDVLAPSQPAGTSPVDGAPAAALPTLRSAVRSSWDSPATIATRGGGACRAQCATNRISCLAPQVQDDVPRCHAQWTSCLSTCDGLTYGRAVGP